MRTVTVLMSSYNGEKYIEEQIESLLQQEDVSVKIMVRDDGSTDGTQLILKRYEAEGKLDWYTGENLGPAKSFMNLVRNAPTSDYYAFCDQDDFWQSDKLKIAIEKLNGLDNRKPCMYYGRPRLVDKNLKRIKSPTRTLHHMDTLYSSIINITCTGCTVVFNRKLLDIMNEKSPEFVWMHDAWIHQVCIITGGSIYFDNDVHILYRQHENNVIGISNSKKNLFVSHLKSLKKKECARSRIMKSLIDNYSDYMDRDTFYVCEHVANYNKGLKKVWLLFNPCIRSAYPVRNILFRLAVLLNAY